MNRHTFFCWAICTCMTGTSVLAAETPRIVPPDHLANYWLVDADSAQANVPNSGSGLDTPSCATVSYVIEKNGTTSHVKLERIVPDGPLGKVATGVVSGLRYGVGPQNRAKDAVSTYVVMPFNLPAADSPNASERGERARILGACKLDSFPSPSNKAGDKAK